MVQRLAMMQVPRQVWGYLRLKSVSWLDADVAACKYPRGGQALGRLAAHGVTVVVNLHERAHSQAQLGRYGLTEVHLPVADFAAPSPAQLAAGVRAIEEAVATNRKVAVHCGGGLGRTGTLLACYLVKRDRLAPAAAIARVRSLRPGSVETSQQEAAVRDFAVALATVQANPFDWLIPGRLAACVNPSVGELAAAELDAGKVGLVINLHERPDPPELLERLGAETLHLPVQNSDPPTPRQLELGVAAISEALARGTPVAVHCAAGLGRTGTLLAAYLVSQGSTAAEAIAQVRTVRPGSVETWEQEQAVHDFARRLAAR